MSSKKRRNALLETKVSTLFNNSDRRFICAQSVAHNEAKKKTLINSAIMRNQREIKKMSKAIEALKNVFVNAANEHESVKNEALAKLETVEAQEEREALTKTAKRANTHEVYTQALAEMSDKALALLHAHKLDAVALAAQSRECKKRSIAMLEAVAHSTRVRDKALDALLQRLAAKSDASLTLEQIKREMQHETTTQASYFKTFAAFFKFAQYSASDKKVTFNYDNAFLKALIEVYSK